MAHHANLTANSLPSKITRYQSVQGTPETLLPQPHGPLGLPVEISGPTFAPYRHAAVLQTVFAVSLALTTVVAVPFAQADWPNPRAAARSVSLLTHTDSFKLPLTTVRPPYQQYDWPVPKGGKPVVVDWVRGTPYSLATSVAPPFFQTNWPVPKGDAPVVADWQRSFPIPLTTVKGTAQYDWPVPRLVPRSISLLTHTASPFPPAVAEEAEGLGTAVQITGPSFRLPPPQFQVTGTPYALTVVVEEEEQPLRPVTEYQLHSRLLAVSTTGPNIVIRGAVQAPFAQRDWPNPRGPKRHQDWVTGLSAELLTSSPFGQLDWPVPRGRKPAVADWEASFPLPLTTHKGTAQYNWPNPLPPRRNEPLGWFEEGLARSTVVVYPATITFDWPNPRGPQPLHRGFSDSFKLPLTTHKGTAQYNWPVPQPPRRNEQLGWFSEGLARTTVVVYPAAITFDWPNPRGDAPLNVGFSDSFKLPLTTHKPPFTQYDWPVPKGAKSDQPLDWSFGATIYSTPIFPEQRQFDWPVPRGYQPLNRGWTDSFKLPLTTHKPPFTQYDWPVPKGAKPNQALGWTERLKITLASVLPFRQSDWPVPKGKVPPVSVKTWADSFKLPLTTHRPHRQHDWPLAVRLRLKVVDWIDLSFQGRFEPPTPIDLTDIDACRTVDVVALDRGYTVPAKVTVNVRFTEDEVTPTPKQDVTVKPINKTTDVDCK